MNREIKIDASEVKKTLKNAKQAVTHIVPFIIHSKMRKEDKHGT
ncbi:hypothetical protein V7069_07440 [Bacillus safensis]